MTAISLIFSPGALLNATCYYGSLYDQDLTDLSTCLATIYAGHPKLLHVLGCH